MINTLGRNVRILAFGALLAAALAPAVDAQTPNPWQAFIGCWMPAEATDLGERGTIDTGNTVLCFQNAGEGVEVSSVVAGEVTSTELLVADGRPRSVPTEECVGSEAIEFSSDGRRAFTRSEITCEGDTRRSSGVMAFVTPTRWVDVRSIEIEGETLAWVQEYSPVNREWYAEHSIENPAAVDDRTMMTQVRRTLASRPVGSDEVEEAVSSVDKGAVEMWLTVQPNEFDLDAREILRLVDTGVPESVIDVMVAAAYPDRFILSLEGAEPAVAEAQPNRVNTRSSIPFRGGFGTYMFNPYYMPSGYRYGGYGYPYYGYDIYRPGGYVGYSGYVGSSIVVEPRDPQSQGRMVNGQGYRRNASTRSAGGGGGSAGSSGSTSGSSVSAASTSSGGSSSSGSSSSGSSSSGSSSSGTSTGRTARPRN